MIFHHVGIAAEDIQDTLAYMKKHFDITDISDTVYDSNQNASLCMITLKGGGKLELVSGEVVKGLLKKRQNLYHTCYSVENIEDKIKELEEDSLIISLPKEAILFGNKKVAFIMTAIGLIELVEEKQ